MRRHCGADLLGDYAPGHPIQRLGLSLPPRSVELERRDGEDLLGYRDRLQHRFFIPARISPLNQPKAAYLEIVNPLQARRVADCRRRPARAAPLAPGRARGRARRPRPDALPFAGREEGALQQFLGAAETRRVLANGLRAQTARSLFDGAALEEVAHDPR